MTTKLSIPENLLVPHEITRESLTALIAAAERSKFEITSWRPRGVPVFDTLDVELEGPAGEAGAIIDHLLKLPGLQQRLQLFPRGIIAFDKIRIAVEATGSAHA